MKRYILVIIIFSFLLIFTLINISSKNNYISLNFLFYQSPPIPGVIIFYIGMLIGSLLTIPMVFKSLVSPNKKVLTEQIKNESKREKIFSKKMDKEHKKPKKKTGNINSNIISMPTKESSSL